MTIQRPYQSRPKVRFQAAELYRAGNGRLAESVDQRLQELEDGTAAVPNSRLPALAGVSWAESTGR